MGVVEWYPYKLHDEIFDTTRDIQYSDEIFCSEKGDLYRFATIVLSEFDNLYAVNPISANNTEHIQQQDDLLVGMYLVSPSEVEFDELCL